MCIKLLCGQHSNRFQTCVFSLYTGPLNRVSHCNRYPIITFGFLSATNSMRMTRREMRQGQVQCSYKIVALSISVEATWLLFLNHAFDSLVQSRPNKCIVFCCPDRQALNGRWTNSSFVVEPKSFCSTCVSRSSTLAPRYLPTRCLSHSNSSEAK